MKKSLQIIVCLTIFAAFSGVLMAQEEIGSTGVDQYTLGRLGVGTSSPSRSITVQPSADPSHAISVRNTANTAEDFTMTVTSGGFGL